METHQPVRDEEKGHVDTVDTCARNAGFVSRVCENPHMNKFGHREGQRFERKLRKARAMERRSWICGRRNHVAKPHARNVPM